jgi:hypothetical protein
MHLIVAKIAKQIKEYQRWVELETRIGCPWNRHILKPPWLDLEFLGTLTNEDKYVSR